MYGEEPRDVTPEPAEASPAPDAGWGPCEACGAPADFKLLLDETERLFCGRHKPQLLGMARRGETPAGEEPAAQRNFNRWAAGSMAEHMIEDIAALDPATRKLVSEFYTRLHLVIIWTDQEARAQAAEGSPASQGGDS